MFRSQLMPCVALVCTVSLAYALAPNSSFVPIASACGPTTANITCIHRYGSVLPPSFWRDSDPNVGYSGTLVPDDPSWAALVPTADFVVFDKELGLELLGPSPKILKNFVPLLNVIHEAPMFVPELNTLFTTQDGPPGNLSNIAIDLSTDPPTVNAFVTDPPVYQPTGGVLHEGYIYWAVQGNNVSLPGGLKQRPGIVRVDPKTYKAEWLLNNYHGFAFGGLNDLAVDSVGDIWFTDSDYAWGLNLAPTANQIQLATYRFRPSTGEVSIVDSTLQHPNGITFSRDGKTLFVTDSGLETSGLPGTDNQGPGNFYNYPIRIEFTSTNARNLYAWDIARPDGPSGVPRITGKRNIFQSLEGSPDGIKIAANGYLVVASGLSLGVDILTADGSVIARIQTNHPVENIAFAGDDLKTLYLVGIGGVSKVEWNLAGPDPKNYYI
ncbi:hypothetical protein IAQ61_003300 [Plenodomus lingam]|uniref:uncharacterized protein n=1 Tax=Leptosphaeria maculans TaxID=5022 RepID=UPI0033250C15|nr:hypothetical protein IAQ61_003300 [Plenodomus lingam]